jgi:hypothetical protein
MKGYIKEIQAAVTNTYIFTPLKEEALAFRNRATARSFIPPTRVRLERLDGVTFTIDKFELEYTPKGICLVCEGPFDFAERGLTPMLGS